MSARRTREDDVMPGSLTLSDAADRKLRELSASTGRPVAEVLERAIDDMHRRAFWAAADVGYAALRADPDGWAAEQADRAAWDATLADGLPPGERWEADGTPAPPGTPP